ncbi:unnamed protein product, partial [Larinioides sclopetarius]
PTINHFPHFVAKTAFEILKVATDRLERHPTYSNMSSLLSICSARTLAIVALAILCCSLLCETRAQQFYPNGRYGRRSVIPPLAESTQDFRVAISGDDSMICKFTGYADYYRCTRYNL